METKPGETLGRSAALAWLVARIRQRTGRTMVAIDGVDGAGKTTFADELATELTDSGLTVIRISFDDFLNPAEIRHRRGRTSPDGFVADTYDYERFIDDVLDPLGCEGCGRYRAKSYDFASETPLNPPWQVAPDNAVVIVDGMFLHHDRLRDERRSLHEASGRRELDLPREDLPGGQLRHREEGIIGLSEPCRQVPGRQGAALVIEQREHVEVAWAHERRRGRGDVRWRWNPRGVFGHVFEGLTLGQLVQRRAPGRPHRQRPRVHAVEHTQGARLHVSQERRHGGHREGALVERREQRVGIHGRQGTAEQAHRPRRIPATHSGPHAPE